MYSINLADDRVYIGGAMVGAEERGNLAALDADGNLLAWNPDSSVAVSVIEVIDNTVYVAGLFPERFENQGFKLVAFDEMGEWLPWDAPDFNSNIYDLEVDDETFYVSGTFTEVGDYVREHLAAIDSTGMLTNWAPHRERHRF